jgi:hypothetical protein
MHKNATKCNKTLNKWCKNKHGASKIMDTLETYHAHRLEGKRRKEKTTQIRNQAQHFIKAKYSQGAQNSLNDFQAKYEGSSLH